MEKIYKPLKRQQDGNVMDFSKLIKSDVAAPEINRAPDDTPVECEMCPWKGILSDCLTEMDSDGWENPDYEVLVCPMCGGNAVNL